MPPLKKTGDYRPTWKLSLTDRQHAKYAHKVIDRIIRQEDRPHRIRKRGMDKPQLITYWVEQDQAIKIEGKPELVADYTSVAGEDGLTPEEWVELAKQLKTATEKYGKKHKANKRKGTATKRKRTASKEIRKTKRTKKNSDGISESASEENEDQEGTDMESEDREAQISDRKPSKDTKLPCKDRILTERVDEKEVHHKARRTRRRGRHYAITGDLSDTEDSVATTKHSPNTGAASKVPAPAGSVDPVHKTAATKKTSAPTSMLPHPRSVRSMKDGVPGLYKRFKPVDLGSSGDSQDELEDDMSVSEDDLIAPHGFESSSAAYMSIKASKEGKGPTTKRKQERKGDGVDLLPRPLPMPRNKQMRMLFEYTENEEGDKPEYATWAKRHASTSSNKDIPLFMPYGMSPVWKRRSKDVAEAEEDLDEGI
ncbi:hypothetical protein HBI67_196630 [Parastagonospora nodorum]|nr:hypothetical protein HBH50_214870 [Parastagonospora nodorum]KAH4080947.1 hypothetical protein HBH48_204120 [Parastagonospora nodorum]KAH6053898.1 hypothetical protein HBI66_233450 [Parastagonospora nodorum]KAH6054455.1 hypothetical protein HBI67_196630 [Parastagonospora nodorum]